MPHNLLNTLQSFGFESGASAKFYSLPALGEALGVQISRLPVSIRIVLESVLRNFDGRKITEDHVRQLAGWQPQAPRVAEIPFVVARILLQDFTGVPLLCDLAAMRSLSQRLGRDPSLVEPLVPVNLVIDHSVQVDHYNLPNAFALNMELEFKRNTERYRFIKWSMQAFDTLRVVPPEIGIVHQVNLEYLARGVWQKDGVYYPDTLVGTDSHTTMINGLGSVAWGVGGIEAEACMLGQPFYFLTPDVVGVHLHGRLQEGTTATDLVLHITERLRKLKVVGKFIEYFGEGAASLALPDRATIGNMSPEYGATMGFFPVDDETVAYLAATGRSPGEIDAFRSYFRAQGLFGMPQPGDIDYSDLVEIDLGEVRASVSGPKRPQDRIDLPDLGARFTEMFSRSVAENGYGKKAEVLAHRYPVQKQERGLVAETEVRSRPLTARHEKEMLDNRPLVPSDEVLPSETMSADIEIGHGDVLIAAITSCTNTSNPAVMLAAGLLAKKAVEQGLKVNEHVKTSLAPGSRVVTEYLKNAGLLPYLEQLGFRLVGYGCTTCIGNSGPLDPDLEETITDKDLICAAVLSGNRNFEARIHPNIKANFLMSPPLVVAFAIAGRVNIDLTREPLGTTPKGHPVHLRDIWPSSREINEVMGSATDPETYRSLYANVAEENPLWNAITAGTGEAYTWQDSTYIAEPPFFQGFQLTPTPVTDIRNARPLAIFGDSVTTDHISPAGSIKPTSPAGQYLQSKDVAISEFNSYGSRRGNHEVMMRGTFANVRIRNLMLPPREDGTRIEGGITLCQPEGKTTTIYEAAMHYMAQGTPTVIFAGEEYGTGSSRDWAAKGTLLLGVKAVIARSFERIHRSNLVCMGVLPLQFKGGDSAQSLGIVGDEDFDIIGVEGGFRPQQDVTLVIRRPDGGRQEIKLLLRIDTPIEVDYYLNGGILPYVFRLLMAA
ncbi:MAG TPA: aconitate hydratase [Rhodocyclaceae bacterium]|nr:aconitate hydratase [Rhodocyclaceae bacterium]